MEDSRKALALQIACLSALHVSGAADRIAAHSRNQVSDHRCYWTPTEIREHSQEDVRR
jgi:hypothetical protein